MALKPADQSLLNFVNCDNNYQYRCRSFLSEESSNVLPVRNTTQYSETYLVFQQKKTPKRYISTQPVEKFFLQKFSLEREGL